MSVCTDLDNFKNSLAMEKAAKSGLEKDLGQAKEEAKKAKDSEKSFFDHLPPFQRALRRLVWRQKLMLCLISRNHISFFREG